ncbi:MAG: choice-of-anchor D domain-containing protein, partial [Candidatus Cloacimonadaceae bacterium]|nr:choice-of-anchor D domain-containing protein [Candidatus Cloacimonadaceae bacterium]
MTKISLLIIMLISLCVAYATIDEYYGFNATTGTYLPITGTAIPAIHVDDALSSPVPIGFTFTHGEMSFTQVQVSSNGWVGLGSHHPNSTLNNALASLNRIPVVAPLWDDLTMAAGNVQYLTTGTAPNRVFTVQYTDARWNFNSPGRFSFQARLYENGKIDMVYGAATGAPNLPSASIGINMTPGGSGWFYSVSPATNTASSTVENTTVNAFPAVGTIYEFHRIIIPANDLMAISLSGNSTPTVGDQNLYSAQIRNRGTSPQTNYHVKLYLAGNVELASVNGPVIQPEEVLSVSMPWTPTTDGHTSLYARVVLLTDQEPSNDQSPDFDIIVMPQGVVTVGDGSLDARMPFDMFYRNSLHQAIYLSAELGQTGRINAIALHNQFATQTLSASPIKLWIGTTAMMDLSSGWIPSTELSLVFDGTIALPAGVNVITIPLSTPFNYTGGNLVLMFYRPMDTGYYSYLDLFKCQSLGSSRARNMFSDSIYLDPAAPLGGTLSGQFPKTSFYMGPHPTEPVFAINQPTHNFGNINVGNDVNHRFSVSNAGAGSLTISSVTISGHNAFTLSNLPALPATLVSGASMHFDATYAPASVGNHAATIYITDNLRRATHSVALNGIGVENNAEIEPPQNLSANVDGRDVHLIWDALIPTDGGFFDDFESYDDFLVNFPPWTCIDLDLSSTYGISGYTWPNDYDAQAYITWNSSATTPPWTNPDATPHSGSKQVACFSSFISPPNNDWLISPPLEITNH